MNRDPQPGRLAAGDEPIPGYHLTEALGRGGYGEVWKASVPGGVSKAVKVIFGDDPARSVTELRALNRVKDIRHPFLLSIERIEQQSDRLVVVTELGDRNLQQHFQAYRAKGFDGVPQAELLYLLRDVADVLDHIYQEFALQHLDIKPANLLLFGKRLKVADFGLVKNIYERAASLVEGLTPTYAAPEIFEGQPSRSSDQYSLAIVYQEMLTGALPFDGATAARLATQHLREAPDLRCLPPEQRPIIARALSKDPLQRYPSCMALLDELASAVQRQSSSDRGGAERTPFLRSAAKPLPAANSVDSAPKPASDVPRPVAQADAASAAAGAEVVDSAPGSPVGPTVVVGLGGSAAQVLQRLRWRVGDRLGGFEAVPGLKLVLIDTDPQTLNEANRDHSAWHELETIAAPLRNPAEYREQGAQHRRWLSRRWLFNVPRSLRTDGLRPLGRLALMSHAPRVLTSLRAAIQDAARASAGTTRPRVLFVSSIAGGTGSGMLLDLAYAARAELRSAGCGDAAVDAVLLYSEPVGVERDKAMLNAVATLRELAHYSRPGSFYPGEPLLGTPSFHGNNRTFGTTEVVHLGTDLDAAAWTRGIDNVAEFVYAQLVSPLDRLRGASASGEEAASAASVDVVQIRQVGGYSGSFIDDLTRQLCVDIVDGWCGLTAGGADPETANQSAATMVLKALENEHNARHLHFVSAADAVMHEAGVELAPLRARTRDMLVQELGADERAYLQSLFQQALTATAASGASPHEIAALVITLQDRAIGLDFGERPADRSHNTLSDLLQSRLSSQSMQLAAQLTAWVQNLVDHPEAGVDGARHAAEALRSRIRDLIGHVAREKMEVHRSQCDARIALIEGSTAGEAAKSGRSWFLGRDHGRTILENKLTAHGLLCFEELLLVGMHGQLRAIEAQLSATIDQLLSLWQELKQLGQRVAAADQAEGAEQGAPMPGYEQTLRKVLLDHRPRLVKELRRRIDQQVLSGPKKLQRFLQQRGAFDHVLDGPLKHHARQVVLQSMRQVLQFLVQNGPAGGDRNRFDLDAVLDNLLNEPLTLGAGQAERSLLVVPADASPERLEERLRAAGRDVQALSVATNNVAVCRQVAGVPLVDVVREISHGNQSVVALAEHLHARTDVAWEPLPTPVGEAAVMGRLGGAADGGEVPATLRLS